MKDLIKLLPKLDAAIAREKQAACSDNLPPEPKRPTTYVSDTACQCGSFERYIKNDDCAPCQRRRVARINKIRRQKKARD